MEVMVAWSKRVEERDDERGDCKLLAMGSFGMIEAT